MVEFHFRENFAFFHPYSTVTAAACLVLVLLVGYRWNEQPRFLRVASLVIIPLVGLTLFLGMLDELRDYYEAFPAIVLLLFHGLACLMGTDVRAQPDTETEPGHSVGTSSHTASHR